MQDELQKACATIEKLRTGLEVGKVSSLVKGLRKETQQMKKETKKPLSYAEAARHGTISHPPTTAKGAAAWSSTRTFFLRPEDESNRTKEIPAWMFGAKLRQKFGAIPEGERPTFIALTLDSAGRMADASRPVGTRSADFSEPKSC